MEKLYNTFVSEIGLSQAHFERFVQIGHIVTLSKKEFWVQEGQICKSLGLVLEGSLRSFLQNQDHEEFNNDFFFEGSFISAYTSFLTQTPTKSTIQALSVSKIISISHNQLEQLLQEDLQWLKVSKYVGESFFIRKCKRESSLLKLSASERLQLLLETYPQIEQKVAQYHIASYLGIKPESLSRIKTLTYINKQE